jgi:hypothetical protein
MFMKLLEEWLDEYSQRPDRDPEWTWSDFENFATWLDNRSAQQSVQADGANVRGYEASEILIDDKPVMITVDECICEYPGWWAENEAYCFICKKPHRR